MTAMPDQFVRVKAIVIRARELSGEARSAYLTEACGQEPALRAEVEALLDHASDTPSILATGGVGRQIPAMLLEELGTETAALPSAIGPYTLLAVLGEGGMGTVYRAEQATPIQRQVALKLVRRGLDTDRIVARFEAERQALALMDHPHIARVIDAGVSPDGRPYFVMELVDGVPVTTFCEQHQIPLAGRLTLFLAICQGVQHAHQRGIIHRDLKPSNILVREQDGVPSPRIIDFGIAKAIGDSHTGTTLMTQAGQFVGTPEYMSPEQAGVLGGGVDTRSDVYSLGVLLYELLTASRPFEFTTYTTAEIQRVLGQSEPPEPSLRATRWRRLLSGDLDNIVFKALAKAPADRYSSVEQFADDIRRHMEGLPVQARAATWTYRAMKFGRRHRIGVGMATAVALLLVGFSGTMVVQSARLAAERDRAVSAEQHARTEAATAGQVADFLVRLFEVSNPSEARGNSITAREILDSGAGRIQKELRDQPEVQASLMDTMGRVYQGLGLFDVGRPLLDDALRVRRTLWGEDHAQVAESLDHVARLAWVHNRRLDVEPMFRQALAMKQKWLGPQHPSVALTMNNLASVLLGKNDFEGADTMAREALAIRRATLGNEHADVAESLHDLAVTSSLRGRLDEAESNLRGALALDRRLHGTDSPVVVIGLNTLAETLRRKADLAGAEVAFVEALEIARRLYGDEHPDVAHTMYNLGRVVFLRGDLDEGERILGESLVMHRKVLGNENVWVANGLNMVGRVRQARGDTTAAERHFRDALRMHRTLYGVESVSAAAVLFNLGSLSQDTGDYPEAESLYRQAVAMNRKLQGDSHPDLAAGLDRLAGLLTATGDVAGAEAGYREALQIRRAALPPRHPDTANTLVGLARVLLQRKDSVGAMPLVKEAIGIRRAALRPGDPAIAAAEQLLQQVGTSLAR